ncbi:MAG: 1-deoxy-D-xylulose-5-phosphate reductoisomerase [Bryobacteraceae bacterium]|nr:1-deoxy-D-xylulose-5-phosphate reductoisomerase [Bryobacteraceae bacterium]
MRNLTILGSTGSIGASTLDVVRRRSDRYRVFALVAGQNVDLLAAQIAEFQPEVVVVATEEARRNLLDRLDGHADAHARRPEVFAGPKARVQAATDPKVDFVMSAIVGVAGLEATYEAVKLGKQIGLANKEVLVASGKLVMDAAGEAGTEIIPVDSEHNGAHQCLKAGRRDEVSRLILTASGGPFRNTPKEKLAQVTPEQALKHPTWKMGKRITIDSATLMNKGFEVIEACWLFGFAPKDIDIVVHPQSSVHALVEYADGSVIAQISVTDMRMPIQYALTYPERLTAPVRRYDWSASHAWEFHPPDWGKFPLLRLAYAAQEAGGSATCTLNAADEIGVESFLNGEIGFTAIAELAEETLAKTPNRTPASVGEVLEIDRESRAVAKAIARSWSRSGRRVYPVARA